MWSSLLIMHFVFQAEDGIRDYKVTGVQTCALPIWFLKPQTRENASTKVNQTLQDVRDLLLHHPRLQENELQIHARSEERRVGKEARERSVRSHGRKEARVDAIAAHRPQDTGQARTR